MPKEYDIQVLALLLAFQLVTDVKRILFQGGHMLVSISWKMISGSPYAYKWF
jgi:hypothetical protein